MLWVVLYFGLCALGLCFEGLSLPSFEHAVLFMLVVTCLVISLGELFGRLLGVVG